MLFIHTGANKSQQSHIIREKSLKFKIGNWERNWSQVTFFNMETPANQF